MHDRKVLNPWLIQNNRKLTKKSMSLQMTILAVQAVSIYRLISKVTGLSWQISWIVLCVRYSFYFYCIRHPLDIGDIRVNESILSDDLSLKEEYKLDSTRLIDLIYSSSILSHGQKISILSIYEIGHCDTSKGNNKITSISVLSL